MASRTDAAAAHDGAVHRQLYQLPSDLPGDRRAPFPGRALAPARGAARPPAARLRRDLPHQRRLHDPRLRPASAHLPGLRRDLQPLRRRVRPDGRGSLHGGLRGDLPPLRRVLRGDGRGYGRSRRDQRIEAEPALRRSVGPVRPRSRPTPPRSRPRPSRAEAARPAARRWSADRDRPPPARPPRRDSSSAPATALAPLGARPLVGGPVPEVPLPPPAEAAVGRRAQPDERRPPPVGAVVAGAVPGPGRVGHLVVLESLAASARAGGEKLRRISLLVHRRHLAPRRSSGPAACGPPP